MVTKQTVAIIGAAGKPGSEISRKLAKGNYRLLLFDLDPALAGIAESIASAVPGADIDIIQCSAEACWESDLIIFAVPAESERSIAEHIVEYSNQKIIISITDSDDQLQHLLPNSKIVKILNRIGVADVDASDFQLPVECSDEDVFELVSGIVETLGFKPFKQIVS
ncbi:MAG: NAD(P)-binding domain-containing protein [Flavitalea sp.]